MNLKRFAMASLVGSATVLAGCGRPATLATPAQIQPDPAAAAKPAQVAAADPQVAPGVVPQANPAGPANRADSTAADPALTPADPTAPTGPTGPTAPVLAPDGPLADGAHLVPDGAVLVPDGETAADGSMSAEFWWLFRKRPTPPPIATPVRPTPPPLYTPPPVRPTPPPLYTPPPVRPTPPPLYTPPPVRPTPPPLYTPPPVRPTPPAVPVDGSRVYGNVGNASVDLSRVTGGENISGSIDGRSVFLTVGSGKLSGSIGYSSNVYLTKDTGYLFLPTNISGTVGNRTMSLNVSGRNTYGGIGSVYFDTSISEDSRTLTGRYDGSSVSVRTSGNSTSGYLGRHNVSITRDYNGRLSGYVGSKRIDLDGDIGPGGFLRRLPLIAADDWLVFSTLTRFFL